MLNYQVTLLNRKIINQDKGNEIENGLFNDNVLMEFKVKGSSIFGAFEQAKSILQSLIPLDVVYTFSDDYKKCVIEFVDSNNLRLKYELKLI